MQHYNRAFAPLLAEQRLMSLGPGIPNESVRNQLEGFDPASAFAPSSISDRSMVKACMAGIWLYHDFLDQSHAISQSIPTPTGSYWHAILHRREPDSWNSKYWFDRVGRHPIFPSLCEAARELVQSAEESTATRFFRQQTQWDAHAFVDLCERCRGAQSPDELLCRTIQLREWHLLFDFCCRRAAEG